MHGHGRVWRYGSHQRGPAVGTEDPRDEKVAQAEAREEARRQMSQEDTDDVDINDYMM